MCPVTGTILTSATSEVAGTHLQRVRKSVRSFERTRERKWLEIAKAELAILHQMAARSPQLYGDVFGEARRLVEEWS
jgi:hypothetical protein